VFTARDRVTVAVHVSETEVGDCLLHRRVASRVQLAMTTFFFAIQVQLPVTIPGRSSARMSHTDPLAARSQVYDRASSGGSRLLAVQRPYYAALGGSNSLGAVDIDAKKNGHLHKPYTEQLKRRLAALGYDYSDGLMGGAGPVLVAACSSRYIPSGTRVATLEYLPNMGFQDPKYELNAMEKLIYTARVIRRASTFLINILPCSEIYRIGQSRGCVTGMFGCTTRQVVEQMGDFIAKLGNAYNTTTITIDCDTDRTLFGNDTFHIAQHTHNRLFDQIWREVGSQGEPSIYAPKSKSSVADPISGSVSSTPSTSSDISEISVGVTCHMGEELGQLVLAANGFEHQNIATPRQRPKIAWLADRLGSTLEFCARLPTREMQAVLSSDQQRVYRSGKLRRRFNSVEPYVISLGVQVSHIQNRPLYGLVHVDCLSGCICNCIRSEQDPFTNCTYDTLATKVGTVTHFLRMRVSVANATAAEGGIGRPVTSNYGGKPCMAPDSCHMRISNSVSGNRSRVAVRALIVGVHDWRVAFLNSWTIGRAHMRDLNRRQ